MNIENLKRALLIVFVKAAYAVFFLVLFPVYFFNKRNFEKNKKTNPFYASKIVKLQQDHPVIYELVTFVANFPMREGVYRVLPKLSGNVLQVGCGTGLLNLYYKKHYRNYGTVNFINMDLNEKALSFGKRLGRFTSYLHANIYRVPLDTESLDCIVFARCLHHIKSHKKMFTECERLLKKDGEIIILDVALLKDRQKRGAPLRGAHMANSSLDGLIWRYDENEFKENIIKTKPASFEILSLKDIRQINITNYNPRYPQTDILAVLKKVR